MSNTTLEIFTYFWAYTLVSTSHIKTPLV